MRVGGQDSEMGPTQQDRATESRPCLLLLTKGPARGWDHPGAGGEQLEARVLVNPRIACMGLNRKPQVKRPPEGCKVRQKNKGTVTYFQR